MRLTDSLRALENARDHARRDALCARLLMCAPDHFGVDYVINPWMEGQIGLAEQSLAETQWRNLRDALAHVAALEFVAPAPGLPDMAFTANAGLVIGGKAVVSRFHAPERRAEEPLFRAFFEARGFDVADWPEDVAFEGAGDALPDRAAPVIWCGHGFRSSPKAAALLEETFERRAIGLRLVDPRFYHLDTCFCPLSDGWLLYYPEAFDAASREAIARHIPEERRIAASETDAAAFACNAVEAGRRVFLNHASDDLRTRLHDAGFVPTVAPLGEFLKAGGGAKCLTLALNGA